MTISSIELRILGAGIVGPGLDGWIASCEALAGRSDRANRATVVPMPSRLAPAERRRAGAAIRLALAVADDACTQAAVDPSEMASVFTTSNGDGANCHSLCESLAAAPPTVSPTRFTNSVHNATAGFWHIAVGGRAASVSLCMHDGSFAAGLIEAALQVQDSGRPVLLVASDVPYPDPLARVRPMIDAFGCAFVLGPRTESGDSLSVTLQPAGEPASTCDDASLERLRANVPAARGLPLLAALARRQAHHLVWDYRPGLAVGVTFTPRAP